MNRMSFFESDRPSPAEFPDGNLPAGVGEPFSDLPKAPLSDLRLIGYLMGEPVAEWADADSEPWRDEQIERWLAQDVANVERLECLAVAIVGLASGVAQPHRCVLADRVDESGPVGSGALAGSGRLLLGRPWLGRRRGWLLAGVCSAVCLAALLWSLAEHSDNAATGRVAMAWSEFSAGEFNAGEADSSVNTPATDGSWDTAAGDWEAGWNYAAEADDFTDVVEETGDESGFATGGDSPPDWLVFAVARLDDSIGPDQIGEDSAR